MPPYLRVEPGFVKLIKPTEAGETIESICGYASTKDKKFYPDGCSKAEEIRRSTHTIERTVQVAQGRAHAKHRLGIEPLIPDNLDNRHLDRIERIQWGKGEGKSRKPPGKERPWTSAGQFTAEQLAEGMHRTDAARDAAVTPGHGVAGTPAPQPAPVHHHIAICETAKDPTKYCRRSFV